MVNYDSYTDTLMQKFMSPHGLTVTYATKSFKGVKYVFSLHVDCVTKCQFLQEM